MTPEYFLIPLIVGQLSNLITAVKTGYIIIDCCLFALIYLIYNFTSAREIKNYIIPFIYNKQKQSIILTATEDMRSIKFRAVMFYLSKQTNSIYKMREVNERIWDDEDASRIEKNSEYMVDQSKLFKLTDKIFGTITNNSKEKVRGLAGTEYIEYNTLKLFSYCLNVNEIQDWVNTIVKNYKQHLKSASNEKQLYITASIKNKKNSNGINVDRNRDRDREKHTGINIEAVPWDSTINFKNSYFHDIEEVIKKIDFFLNNKQWYVEKGIPYNLGILLHGEPGCGKTRFIKQLLNHTGRHAIDIKLNDSMDYNDLYNIIFKEEIGDDYIIPQDQRILIFEDIDAMGEAVKSRDNKDKPTVNGNVNNLNDSLKLEESNAKEDDFENLDTKTILAELLNNNKKNKDNYNKESNILTSLTTINNNKIHGNNLSYLLNMFDGINECSGRIIIMTSNKPEILDKALIRPGRIDIKIHFDKCTTYDVMRLINLFWNKDIQETSLLPELNMKYTSADVYNIFRTTNNFEEIKSQFITK